MKRKSPKKESKKTNVDPKTVPVLCQNIGGEIYAFAQVGAEVYFGKVPIRSTAQEVIAKLMEKDAA